MKAEVNITLSYNQLLNAIRQMDSFNQKKLFHDLFLNRLESFNANLLQTDLDQISEDEILDETTAVRLKAYEKKKTKLI